MENDFITMEQITTFQEYLIKEEKAAGTVEKYIRDITRFSNWLSGKAVTKQLVCEWKEYLIRNNYAATTINSMLASLHGYFRYYGLEGCSVKFLKIQRRIFREESRELTKEDYQTLIQTANKRGNERTALLIEAMGATGIRVSEVKYITVEALKQGRTEVALKGKIRTIFFPSLLSKKLLKYAKKNRITNGEIFITRNGNGLSRKQIWAEMKNLCQYTKIERTKVFPHNLRHMFARVFYKASRDIVRLADVLGHSNIETTRIYLLTTGEEYRGWLERLQLVC